jgi:hypothetical protein
MTLTRNQKALLIWVGLLIIVLLTGTDAPASAMLIPTLLLLADSAGNIAKKKGRSYLLFFALSWVLPFLTLIIASAIKPKLDFK